jgi:hypothetical protein
MPVRTPSKSVSFCGVDEIELKKMIAPSYEKKKAIVYSVAQVEALLEANTPTPTSGLSLMSCA